MTKIAFDFGSSSKQKVVLISVAFGR